MMSLAKIKEYCRKAFEKAGYDFNAENIEIRINGRLTRTLGRCFTEIRAGVAYPTKIEFSRQLLETSVDDSIIAVIEHECCHALVALETGERHGHDAVFKRMCARIGCTNDGTSTHVERTVADSEIYKYSVYCDKCGFVAGYNRMCKTLRELDYCTCKQCGGHKLFYIQNH
jgi:predicted SprT family Zn-dependent metalloprotease